MSDKVFWVEQRYVVPVVASSTEEALSLIYDERMAVARETSPVAFRQYVRGSRLGERDGWHGCLPYGRHDGRTVDQWEPGKYGTPEGTIGAQSNPEPSDGSTTSADRT